MRPGLRGRGCGHYGGPELLLAAALAYLSDDPAGPYEEERVREATHRGSAAGALACTDYGAMRALPTKDELERFLDGQK